MTSTASPAHRIMKTTSRKPVRTILFALSAFLLCRFGSGRMDHARPDRVSASIWSRSRSCATAITVANLAAHGLHDGAVGRRPQAVVYGRSETSSNTTAASRASERWSAGLFRADGHRQTGRHRKNRRTAVGKPPKPAARPDKIRQVACGGKESERPLVQCLTPAIARRPESHTAVAASSSAIV